jgi:hypothetical protein
LVPPPPVAAVDPHGIWQKSRPKQRSKLWYVLGGGAGALLLICVACVVLVFVVKERAGITTQEDAAGEAARREVQYVVNGQHLQQWQMLHPVHQRAVDAKTFVACGPTLETAEVRVILEHNQKVNAPILGEVDARVVTLSVSSASGNTPFMVPMVEVDGQWRWLLSSDDLATFQSGRCP